MLNLSYLFRVLRLRATHSRARICGQFIRAQHELQLPEQLHTTHLRFRTQQHSPGVGISSSCYNLEIFFFILLSPTLFSSINTDPNMVSMHIDVYFQSPWFIKYRTHMRFTFVELLGIFHQLLATLLHQSINILVYYS